MKMNQCRNFLIALIMICITLSFPYVLMLLGDYPYRLDVQLGAHEETWLTVQQPLPVDHLDIEVNGDPKALEARVSTEPIVELAANARRPISDSINLCRTGGAVEFSARMNGSLHLIWESNSTVPFNIYLDYTRVNASVVPAHGRMTIDMPLERTYTDLYARLPTRSENEILFLQAQRSAMHHLRIVATESMPECTDGGVVTLWTQLAFQPVIGTFGESEPLSLPLKNYRLSRGKMHFFIVRNLRDAPVAFTMTAPLTTGGYWMNVALALLSGWAIYIYIFGIFCFLCYLLVELLRACSRGHRLEYAVLLEAGSANVMASKH